MRICRVCLILIMTYDYYFDIFPYRNQPIRTKIELVALKVFDKIIAKLFNSIPYNNQIIPPIVKNE